MNDSYATGIFVDAQKIAVVQGGYGHISVEVVGHNLAIGDVIAQNGVLDIAAVRVDSSTKLRRNVPERLVGRSQKSEGAFRAQLLIQARFFDIIDKVAGSKLARCFQHVLQRFH